MAITQQQKEEYRNYLRYDPRWKAKRDLILIRDNWTCQRCNEARATQVHHKTYKRIYRERMADLMAVCAACHMAIHGIVEEEKPKRISVFGIGKVLAKVIR